MKVFLMVVLSLTLTGLTACTSSRTWVASPMESKIGKDIYHWHNLVVLKDKADMFHVTESRSWMEFCKTKIENPKTQDEWDYPYQDCVRESPYIANGAPSVAQQAVTPIVTTGIQAGGFVGGMHLLGQGIKGSASRTTNNNSTSSEGGNGGEGGDGGSASARSSAAAKNNSDNVTKNHNNQTYNNHNKTNINSNNNFGGKH